MANQDVWELDPRCTRLPDFPEGVSGQFVRLENGELLAVRDNTTIVSQDDGVSWSERGPVYAGPKPGISSFLHVLVQTRNGTTVLVYLDHSTIKWGWDDAAGKAVANAQLDVWSVRSTDGGQTWRDRQMIMQGFCGALITMIQLSSGEIVAPVADLLRDPDRHAVKSYVSEDDGKSWRHGNIIDLGGHGNHDGAMEGGTLAELRDGSVLMLIRTSLDRLWEARSLDKGRYWRVIRPTKIDSSNSPASIRRLASGRLCLVWNRLYLRGMNSGPRRGGQYSEVEASWQRTEISIAFSEDEAQSWTEPQVFLSRHARDGFAYPSIFEPSPGLLWINSRYRAVSLREEDFI